MSFFPKFFCTAYSLVQWHFSDIYGQKADIAVTPGPMLRLFSRGESYRPIFAKFDREEVQSPLPANCRLVDVEGFCTEKLKKIKLTVPKCFAP